MYLFVVIILFYVNIFLVASSWCSQDIFHNNSLFALTYHLYEISYSSAIKSDFLYQSPLITTPRVKLFGSSLFFDVTINIFRTFNFLKLWEINFSQKHNCLKSDLCVHIWS